jgi:hypothetical protein
VKAARVLAASTLLAVLLSGCGISFDEEEGTEFFVSLRVSGAMVPNATLTAAVAYEQYYPIEVTFRCELVRDAKLLREIGLDTVPSHPAGGPEATPFPGNISFDFSVDEPGAYEIECYTPDDEDNIIDESFTIAPAT